MKKSLVILTVLLAVGCRPMTAEQRLKYEQAQYMKDVDTVCLRGVVYYVDKHHKLVTAPVYNQDGTLVLCIDDGEMKNGSD